MKLVETDTPHEEPESEVTPPRPEHRRVAVSALLTISVLTATVVTIYLVFPKRNNQLMTRAFEFHRSDAAFDLNKPKQQELATFALGVLGKVPFPEGKHEILGVTATRILSYPAVMVRYKVGGRPVSLVVSRARDTVPRRYRRTKGAFKIESWRKQEWTFVAVGAAERPDDWHAAMGVP